MVTQNLQWCLDWACGDGPLSALWTGEWGVADRQKVIDREAEQTERIHATYGPPSSHTPRSRRTSRPELLGLLDAADELLTEVVNNSPGVTDDDLTEKAKALRARIRRITR